MDYRVLSYLLLLEIAQTREIISVSLATDETEVILNPGIGLEANQKYIYEVTAINAVGNATSHQDGINLCQL